MRRFALRSTVVLVVALAIVGIGFGLKQWEPVANYFSKDGGARQEQSAGAGGDESVHEDKPGESKGDGPVDSPTAAGSDPARPAGETGEVGAGDESVHPEGDKSDFEKWPSTDTSELVHAFQIMLPILGVVVIYDQVRRKANKTKRLGGAVRAGPAPA